MRRILVWALGLISVGWWALRGLERIDDPIPTLIASNPIAAELFHRFDASGLIRDKVHIDASDLDPSALKELVKALSALGYEPWELSLPPRPPALVPLVPRERILALMAPELMAQRAAAIAQTIGMVGSLPLFFEDPFGLAAAIHPLRQDPRPSSEAKVLTFKAPSGTDYERTGRLVAMLRAMGPRVHAIGGELFAYENYRAVNDDIERCLWLSVPLGILVFIAFSRDTRAVILFLAGSVVSYVAGLAALKLCGFKVQGLVLAFTSTFIGFNNEYLVHLAGLDRKQFISNAKALTSAIGTTLIGFVVLFLSRAEIVRQIALVSLGGMAGFLVFLYAFREQLVRVRIRTVRTWGLSLSPPVFVGIAMLVALGLLTGPRLQVKTEVDTFRFESPWLAGAVQHFESVLGRLGAGNVYAFPAVEDAEIGLRVPGLSDGSFQPLIDFPPLSEQRARLALYARLYPTARKALLDALVAQQLELNLPALPPPMAPLGFSALNEWLASWWPVPVAVRLGDQWYFYASRSSGETAALPEGAIPISPRLYYNALLTDLSQEMVGLFALGVGIMVLYLVPLVRRGLLVLAIMVPLGLAALSLLWWLAWHGRDLNLIHVMAFALVIALAIDYGAMTVATDFRREELSKVLMTGLMTLTAFAPLVAARHPILRDLGEVVTIGAGTALVAALCLRIGRTALGEGA